MSELRERLERIAEAAIQLGMAMVEYPDSHDTPDTVEDAVGYVMCHNDVAALLPEEREPVEVRCSCWEGDPYCSIHGRRD